MKTLFLIFYNMDWKSPPIIVYNDNFVDKRLYDIIIFLSTIIKKFNNIIFPRRLFFKGLLLFL